MVNESLSPIQTRDFCARLKRFKRQVLEQY